LAATALAGAVTGILCYNCAYFGWILGVSMYLANALTHAAYNVIAKREGLAPLELGVSAPARM
jgi:hypothetical protein